MIKTKKIHPADSGGWDAAKWLIQIGNVSSTFSIPLIEFPIMITSHPPSKSPFQPLTTDLRDRFQKRNSANFLHPGPCPVLQRNPRRPPFESTGWRRHLHPRKLAWIPNMMVWKTWLLLSMAIFGIYLKFLGCKYPVSPSRLYNISKLNIRPRLKGRFPFKKSVYQDS